MCDAKRVEKDLFYCSVQYLYNQTHAVIFEVKILGLC